MRLRDRSDELSWPEFHERYGQLLYRYARARGAKHEEAEDIVQEVELGLFKAIEGFEYDTRKGRFRNYLRSAVIHTMGRRARRDARQPVALNPEKFDYVNAAQEASIDTRWEREWQLHRLRWALRSIASGFNRSTLEAFETHVLGGESVDETAEKLGISKASVYQARSRVLKRLKQRLAEADPDGDV
jgi:RNA polymerase sigma-70 factor (ECF subfamily)